MNADLFELFFAIGKARTHEELREAERKAFGAIEPDDNEAALAALEAADDDEVDTNAPASEPRQETGE